MSPCWATVRKKKSSALSTPLIIPNLVVATAHLIPFDLPAFGEAQIDQSLLQFSGKLVEISPFKRRRCLVELGVDEIVSTNEFVRILRDVSDAKGPHESARLQVVEGEVAHVGNDAVVGGFQMNHH